MGKVSLSSLAAVLLTAVLGAEPAPVAPVRPFESPAELAPVGKIDKLVFARLKALGLQPSPLCSDAVFVRRVYLDVIGTLPTAAEAREFLLDRNPDKRRVLIDRLLGARRICRLLGDEMERSAADQGRVSY